MDKKQNQEHSKGTEKETVPTVSGVFDDGTIVEMVYDPEKKSTSFVVWQDGKWTRERSFSPGPGRRLIPFSPNNNLILHNVVLLPSEPEEYGSEEELVAEVRTFIHRYVHISPLFEQIASYYVLFSWIYDGFNELPYLRLRGDPGSGKTRFLLTVGSLCYKPIFASGASTISPIFRILDAFKGTLIIDEGDFKQSDERSEIAKILNNGNVKGFPVLRSEMSDKKEFNPKAYAVYGPKLVATRGFFEDRALESRFLTEEMSQHKVREDIPINLSSDYKEDALRLRNKLLLFRFRNLNKKTVIASLVDRTIEPRLNQIFVPLLSIIDDPQTREDLQELARSYNREMIEERGMDMEAQVLEVIRDMRSSHMNIRLTIKDITSWFVDRHGDDFDRKVTAKWIGWVIRKRLNLRTHKSHGVYMIPSTEESKLDRLFERYGIGVEEEADTEETEAIPHPPPRVDMGGNKDIDQGYGLPPLPEKPYS